ncbi:MAG: YabP/YqfC family sporulation protein [Clostridia bacterium]|nr:YabP/YqfC family sporulation protein [Clostridia bacterium]
MAFSDYQQNRTPLSHRICDKLELDEDICRNCGYIEIISNCCALIDGCKGISEYSENKITLNLGKRNVSFQGNSLTIKSLSMEQAMVEGFIVNVEFTD